MTERWATVCHETSIQKQKGERVEKWQKFVKIFDNNLY